MKHGSRQRILECVLNGSWPELLKSRATRASARGPPGRTQRPLGRTAEQRPRRVGSEARARGARRRRAPKAMAAASDDVQVGGPTRHKLAHAGPRPAPRGAVGALLVPVGADAHANAPQLHRSRTHMHAHTQTHTHPHNVAQSLLFRLLRPRRPRPLGAPDRFCRSGSGPPRSLRAASPRSATPAAANHRRAVLLAAAAPRALGLSARLTAACLASRAARQQLESDLQRQMQQAMACKSAEDAAKSEARQVQVRRAPKRLCRWSRACVPRNRGRSRSRQGGAALAPSVVARVRARGRTPDAARVGVACWHSQPTSR